MPPLLKRLWRVPLVRVTVWFPALCLLLALGSYFLSDPLWWDWHELLSMWGWSMAILGLLGTAVILVPAGLFHIGNKWEAKPTWLLDDDEENPARWKVSLSMGAYIAGVIWVCCLIGFWLFGGFLD